MATYMSSFIPNLADHTAPLRNLLKENVDFAWNPSHSKAFAKVKSLICTTTILACYDRKEPVVLHVDASLKGLGAALFQNDKPIAFASKALTPAETRTNERTRTDQNERTGTISSGLRLRKIPFVLLWKIVRGYNRPSSPRADP